MWFPCSFPFVHACPVTSSSSSRSYVKSKTIWMGSPLVVVLVVTVHVDFELPTVADDLVATLLKRDLHVLGRPNVGPEGDLMLTHHMLGPNRSSLRIDKVLFAHGVREFVRALPDQPRWLRLPKAVLDRPCCDFARGGWPRLVGVDVFIDDALELFCVAHRGYSGQKFAGALCPHPSVNAAFVTISRTRTSISLLCEYGRSPRCWSWPTTMAGWTPSR